MSNCSNENCGCKSEAKTNDPNRIICGCMGVSYIDIRKAMINGVRTLEELQEATGAGTGCGACVPQLEEILASVCGCKNVSMDQVVNAVKSGADTVEKVGEATGAGTGCGHCKPLIQNIIDKRG